MLIGYSMQHCSRKYTGGTKLYLKPNVQVFVTKVRNVALNPEKIIYGPFAMRDKSTPSTPLLTQLIPQYHTNR